MIKGMQFALAACMIWGLIFVVPQFMTGFSPFEVAFARYLFYGAVSSLIFFSAWLKGRCRHSRDIWIKAIYFSLVSTFGYYTCLVLALRYSSPAISALVLGISPISIAFYGNWRQKEVSFRSLIGPSLLILIGLIIINAPHLENSLSPIAYLAGLLCSGLALACWSWFVVANSRFLKDHPHVSSSDWSTIIGVMTVFWVALCACFVSLFFAEQLHIEKYFMWNDDLKRFLIGGAILGLLCSWVGAFLWNKASLHLPVSLAGQLTIFETLFGVLYVYIVAQTTPTLVESVGMVILVAAILYGISNFAKAKVSVH